MKKIEVYVTKQGEYTILNLMKKSVCTAKNQIYMIPTLYGMRLKRF